MDTCKLTGKKGKFVSSHIIPKALTKPAARGMPFVESGDGKRPRRRWSSWTDKHLVVQAGEDLLASLDSWAIAELRRLKLIWSGWGPLQNLGSLHDVIPGSTWGVRDLNISEPTRLRLFYLSLLWRAAASSRPEFAGIAIPSEDEEKLRQMLLARRSDPLSFYPTSLTQLSTLGITHNITPFAQVKTNPATDVSEACEVPFFRFYFDGLIAHVHRHTSDNGETVGLGPLVVGHGTKLVVSTVTYEESFERENMESLITDTHKKWPDVMAKLSGS
jgi:hypothetical protein